VHLRVYPESPVEYDHQEPDVRVRLGDLLALIAFAKKNNYLWLQDFLDDEVAVTADLYDVLRAFGTCLRPSA
jgi:hypothetical protein